MKLPPAVLGALSAALFLVSSAVVLAVPLPAQSHINAVTVYTDRAVVTRTAPLDLTAPGMIEVTFEKLPSNLVDQSLQVAGHGAAQVAILDVTARATQVDFTPDERVKTLEDERSLLARQRRVLDDRGALLKAQEGSLSKLEAAATAAPTKDSAPRLSIDESAKLLMFMEEQRGKLNAERQSLDLQLEDLITKVEVVQCKLAELRSVGNRSYKTVVVRLDVATAGGLDLALSYSVPGASWTPSYDARVTSSDKTVVLAYHGVVRQTTGEDWKDVALTLSTARPALGGLAPRLEPWRIGRNAVIAYNPPSSSSSVLNNISTLGNALNNVSPVLPVKPLEPGTTEVAAGVESGATSATFKINAPSSIPSDNSTQRVPIVTVSLRADFQYLATPKLQALAFLAARAQNASEFPLLTGTMNVFLDGTFVATSALRTVMPGERFDLALGVDEGIAVKHKRLRRFTEDTGLGNRGRRITYEYLLTLQNNKKTAERVLVSDQVPLSDNERIVVKQLVPDLREMKPTADGMLKWTLDLKPGEKRELTVQFTVDHPSDLPFHDGEADGSAILGWSALTR